jgi:hypothetical protein
LNNTLEVLSFMELTREFLVVILFLNTKGDSRKIYEKFYPKKIFSPTVFVGDVG